MKTYTERLLAEDYPEATSLALKDLATVRRMLITLPDDDGETTIPIAKRRHDQGLWTCHALCRAALSLGLNLPWQLRDGHYGQRRCNHAWLECTLGAGDWLVLDVYPVGHIGGPFLVDGHVAAELYQAPRYTPEQLEAFNAQAARAAAHLKPDENGEGEESELPLFAWQPKPPKKGNRFTLAETEDTISLISRIAATLAPTASAHPG